MSLARCARPSGGEAKDSVVAVQRPSGPNHPHRGHTKWDLVRRPPPLQPGGHMGILEKLDFAWMAIRVRIILAAYDIIEPLDGRGR